MTTAPMPVAPRRRAGRPLRTLLAGVAVLAVAIFGDDVYGIASAGGKAPAVLTETAEPVHIVVEMSFEPERYHLERLSSLGSYAGRDREKSRIRLLNVSQDHLTDISRLPWVTKIEPVLINN